MRDGWWSWIAALYFPVCFTAIIGFLRGRQKRMFAACLLGGLWVAVSLPVLELINARAGWWSYLSSEPTFCGMPIELYFGWIVWWGILPQIVLDGLSIAWSIVMLVVLDRMFMPHLPLLGLQHKWLIGEGAAVLIVLLPALCLARCTFANTHLRMRAAMQTALAAGLFLYLIPELVFAVRPGRRWMPLLALPGWEKQIAAQIVLLLAVPGIAAVMEFALQGGGTPIPYDPPPRLVTSGVYRYCANPMQLSCTLVMLCWATLLRNGWLVMAAAVAIIYGAGIADWDESQDLEQRFGEAWKVYRREVRNWFPRWRPYHAGPPARLYVAATCGPCTELRAWIHARNPIGLEMIDAETLAPGSIRRLRYDPGNGSDTVDGLRAFGRALEHLNLCWAIAGAAIRLPVVWQSVQLLMDASGFGPRTICAPRKNHRDSQEDSVNNAV
jgi:protein-S-isoprenylcysteine O-methyltransferase Ste14